jgi:hypothetical protein
MTEKDSTELRELAQQLHSEATTPSAVAAPLAVSVPYTPERMVQLMIDHPHYTHADLAKAFGRLPSWTSAVLASDAFQQALDGRRHEVADPSLSATMEERFKGLAIRAATVLQEKLNGQGVSDLVVLKAAELGIKALGLGAKAPEAPQAPRLENSSQSIAEKLLQAMDARDRTRTVDVETVEVKSCGE